MNQPCNHIKALLSRPLHPAEPVTCFRLQEVLCDLRSTLQKQRGWKDDRKVNGEQGEKGKQPAVCVWHWLGISQSGPDEAEMQFNT